MAARIRALTCNLEMPLTPALSPEYRGEGEKKSPIHGTPEALMKSYFVQACSVFALVGLLIVGCKKDENQSANSSTASSSTEKKTRKVFKAPQGEPLKFAFIINNPSDFWTYAQAGINKFHGEHPDVNVEM